jgi:hypothetical protein
MAKMLGLFVKEFAKYVHDKGSLGNMTEAEDEKFKKLRDEFWELANAWEKGEYQMLELLVQRSLNPLWHVAKESVLLSPDEFARRAAGISH